MNSTMTSVGEGVSDFPPMMRRMCSVTTDVSTKVIENMTEGVEDGTGGIARAQIAPEEPSELSNSKRLHNFGSVEFENVRKIHRDIMLSMAESTDERAGLGKLVRLIRWCYAREA